MRFRFGDDYVLKSKGSTDVQTLDSTSKDEIFDQFSQISKHLGSKEFLKFLTKIKDSGDREIDELVDRCKNIALEQVPDSVTNLVVRLKKFALDYEQEEENIRLTHIKNHVSQIKEIYREIEENINVGDKYFYELQDVSDQLYPHWHSTVSIVTKLVNGPPETADKDLLLELLSILKDTVRQFRIKSNYVKVVRDKNAVDKIIVSNNRPLTKNNSDNGNEKITDRSTSMSKESYYRESQDGTPETASQEEVEEITDHLESIDDVIDEVSRYEIQSTPTRTTEKCATPEKDVISIQDVERPEISKKYSEIVKPDFPVKYSPIRPSNVKSVISTSILKKGLDIKSSPISPSVPPQTILESQKQLDVQSSDTIPFESSGSSAKGLAGLRKLGNLTDSFKNLSGISGESPENVDKPEQKSDKSSLKKDEIKIKSTKFDKNKLIMGTEFRPGHESLSFIDSQSEAYSPIKECSFEESNVSEISMSIESDSKVYNTSPPIVSTPPTPVLQPQQVSDTRSKTLDSQKPETIGGPNISSFGALSLGGTMGIKKAENKQDDQKEQDAISEPIGPQPNQSITSEVSETQNQTNNISLENKSAIQTEQSSTTNESVSNTTTALNLTAPSLKGDLKESIGGQKGIFQPAFNPFPFSGNSSFKPTILSVTQPSLSFPNFPKMTGETPVAPKSSDTQQNLPATKIDEVKVSEPNVQENPIPPTEAELAFKTVTSNAHEPGTFKTFVPPTVPMDTDIAKEVPAAISVKPIPSASAFSTFPTATTLSTSSISQNFSTLATTSSNEVTTPSITNSFVPQVTSPQTSIKVLTAGIGQLPTFGTQSNFGTVSGGFGQSSGTVKVPSFGQLSGFSSATNIGQVPSTSSQTGFTGFPKVAGFGQITGLGQFPTSTFGQTSGFSQLSTAGVPSNAFTSFEGVARPTMAVSNTLPQTPFVPNVTSTIGNFPVQTPSATISNQSQNLQTNTPIQNIGSSFGSAIPSGSFFPIQPPANAQPSFSNQIPSSSFSQFQPNKAQSFGGSSAVSGTTTGFAPFPSSSGMFGSFAPSSSQQNPSSFSSAFSAQQSTFTSTAVPPSSLSSQFGSMSMTNQPQVGTSPFSNPSLASGQQGEKKSGLFSIPDSFNKYSSTQTPVQGSMGGSSMTATTKFNPMPVSFGSFSAISTPQPTQATAKLSQSPFANLIAQNQQNNQNRFS
ncbi:hypothetical protein RF11_10420 [Thelohanellus kitauei]|uniref:Uncharacterized protein n=1 Tax=Thelohanellus kitauei TaxID=669202 RepID=A0A0C2NMA1_THEKT|nr:hypothetical protein RF11_10420 [Thelohanellus kitauei]